MVQPKSQTPEEWLKEMEGIPCYRPCHPFYDFCNQIGHPAEGRDCDKCVDEHQLKDYIE